MKVEDDQPLPSMCARNRAGRSAGESYQAKKAISIPFISRSDNSARGEQDFAGDYAVVNNLQLKRDAGNFTLKSGELYFITPVEERVTAAVFIGDGELSLTPPTEVEKHSLKIFTGEGSITEHFTRLVLRFTDKTFEEIKKSPNATMKTGGPAASQARGLYRDNQELLRKRLRDNRELRTLLDLYNPAREGFFAPSSTASDSTSWSSCSSRSAFRMPLRKKSRC